MCRGASALLRRLEPLIVLEQLGSSLFDTALQLVARDRCANASSPDGEQKAMTDFFMVYNLLIQLLPIVPAVLLARLGDRGKRKVPIVVPLVGYLLSRLALLLVVWLRLPLRVMFGAAVVFGLSGGFSAYWPGVMTLASLRSTEARRSIAMMTVELLYGAAGVVGSLASGHLFQVYSPGVGHGSILLVVSSLLHLLCLLHSVFLLQVTQVPVDEPEENHHLLSPTNTHTPVIKTLAGLNMLNLVLLFTAAILYDFAVGGAMEILGSFVLKPPLSWNAAQVGYGNAAGSAIFLTSFLGVLLFRRCFSDVALILIGLLSFASGIFFMSFVTATYMFYLARLLTLFALIPMPTIRSLVSQQVPASSCGTTLTSLELSLKFAGMAYIPTFTKLYQATLDWFPGFVFMLSSIFTALAMIPVSIVGCRAPQATVRADSGNVTFEDQPSWPVS